MIRTATDYLEQAKALLPRGVLWDSLKETGTTFESLLRVLAEELARIDARIEDLLDELDPRATYELLAEWEKWAGLPDSCITTSQTLQQRREALQSQLTNDNGQSRQFFIDLAASLGYIIAIIEFSTPDVGVAAAGDPINSEDWRFAWQVNAPETTVTEATVGNSTAGEPLRSWGNEIMECIFNKLAHSHRHIIFSYGG